MREPQSIEQQCTCVSCPECRGIGSVWISCTGEYLGSGRCDDMDDLERCEECDGSGIVERCDLCADRDDDYDPYEAAGESPFSLPGGGRSL